MVRLYAVATRFGTGSMNTSKVHAFGTECDDLGDHSTPEQAALVWRMSGLWRALVELEPWMGFVPQEL
jgi:hypothetical protein